MVLTVAKALEYKHGKKLTVKEKLEERRRIQARLLRLEESNVLKLQQIEEEKIKAAELKKQAEIERKQAEEEYKTKHYFEVNKFNRRKPASDTPIYYGDVTTQRAAWIAHGEGKFFLRGKLKLEGLFHHGDFLGGKVCWEDGTIWEGVIRDHQMQGVGVITEPNKAPRDVLMKDNVVVCYRDELREGMQLEFTKPCFDFTPTPSTFSPTHHKSGRRPRATVLKVLNQWRCLLRFHDEVWPKERKINLAAFIDFEILTSLPLIHSFQTFGLRAEAPRVYDYRQVRWDNDVRNMTIRTMRNNELFKKTNEEDMITAAEQSLDLIRNKKKNNTSVSFLEMGDPILDLQENSMESSITNENAGGKKIKTKSRDPLRLLEKFPYRDGEQEQKNIFESAAVGIGAAEREEEEKRQKELKKAQFKALIEDRRLAQQQKRMKEIEDDEKSALESALASRKMDKIKQAEEDEVSRKIAFEDEMSKFSSETRSRRSKTSKNTSKLTDDEFSELDSIDFPADPLAPGDY